MSYATLDKFQQWFEGSSIRLDDYMQELNLEKREQLLTDAIDTAAMELNMVLEAMGYTIPLDTSTIADATLKQQVDAWLEKRNIDLAVLELSTGVLRLPEAVVDQAARVRDMLQNMLGDEKPHFDARGRYRYLVAKELPGLPI